MSKPISTFVQDHTQDIVNRNSFVEGFTSSHFRYLRSMSYFYKCFLLISNSMSFGHWSERWCWVGSWSFWVFSKLGNRKWCHQHNYLTACTLLELTFLYVFLMRTLKFFWGMASDANSRSWLIEIDLVAPTINWSKAFEYASHRLQSKASLVRLSSRCQMFI